MSATPEKPRHEGEPLAKDRWPDLRVSEIEAMKADAEKASRYLSLLQTFAHRTGALAGDDVIEHFHRWCDGHDRQMPPAPAALGTPEGERIAELEQANKTLAAQYTGLRSTCARRSAELASQARTIAALRGENAQLRNRVVGAADDALRSLDEMLAALGFRPNSPMRMKIARALKEHPNG